MTDETQSHGEVSTAETMFIRSAESAYAVPRVVLEQHRLQPEQRAQIEAELRERVSAAEGVTAEAPLYALEREALAQYRLSDEERAVLEAQHARAESDDDAQGFGHMPIRKYTGYAWDTYFGGFERGQYGGVVYIGVFPMERQPSGSGPYPGLR